MNCFFMTYGDRAALVTLSICLLITFLTYVYIESDTTVMQPMLNVGRYLKHFIRISVITPPPPRAVEDTTRRVTALLQHRLYTNASVHQLGAQSAPSTNRTLYLCPAFIGRLGNLMFQYASVYGLAKTNGYSVGITVNSKMFKTFELTVKAFNSGPVCSKRAKIHSINSRRIERFSFPKDSNVTFHAYLQSWKYFETFKEDIRQQLRFKNTTDMRARKIIKNIIPSHLRNYFLHHSVTTVGVHVRRGDFGGAKGRGIADASYLSSAMDYFRKRYKPILFLVTTNPDESSRKWCLDNIRGNDTVLVPVSPAEVDLAILASCNHTVMTAGTFGWWAGWLANGTTIYYKNVTWDEKRFSREDYFYPGWIGM